MKTWHYSLFFFAFGFLTVTIAQNNVKPPIAKTVEHKTEIHGQTLTDNYFWLREKSNPEVVKYLKEENAYTSEIMKPTEQLQKKLYKEMLSRIQQTDEDVPYKKGNYFYYTRNIEGKQYPLYCRKKGSIKGKEEILLNINELAKGCDYYRIGSFRISDDAKLLAITIDTTGFRQYFLRIKDLQTGKFLNDTAERVVNLEWASDNKSIVYIQEDNTTKRSDKSFLHKIGESKDKLLYEEKDELYDVRLSKTNSNAFILLTSISKNTTEVRYINTDKPEEVKLLYPKKENHEYYVDNIDDQFYIRTNDKGKNFRLVIVSVKNPAKENAKEIIPHRSDVFLEGILCFSNHFITEERKNGISQFNINDLKTGSAHYIEFPEPAYSIYPSDNEEFITNKFRINYESLVTPTSVYDYDINTRKLSLLKREKILGGYKSSNYKSERLLAKASDGTLIPISLVYKKGIKPDGTNPLHLYAYGSYGASSDPNFSSDRLSLLDRGFVYAIAHIRGGSEMGKEWYEDGKLMKKKNTFTDFIACAEYLIKEKYTSSEKLIISGGSAGGLLMGAVTNMRPDLFKAVISYVPFVDVVNTMLDATLPLTTQEYIEWGNPNIKTDFDYMMTYSPYNNIQAKNYPPILVRTSFNDSQVMYWEPAKYVAKMRALKTDNNPLLFKTRLEPGGHGGASGRYDRLKDTAFDYAYILWQVGINK